ncbi:MAG: acyltransferase domain-containing protein [Oscillospiraceae bacterium]|nr:acyltransferase domain-containing protein [Oscillospiraceae bacterium]
MSLLKTFKKYFGYYALCDEGRAALLMSAEAICSDENLSAKALELKTKLTDLSYEFDAKEEFKDKPAQFIAFVYTLALEDMEKLYKEKNIPEDILFATADDLSVWINRHHNWFGEWGLSEFGWLTLHIRAKIFKLGRLQFEPAAVNEPPPEESGLNLKKGDNFLSVHIPRGGSLDAEACLDSFERAKEFFPKYLNYDFKAFGCFTWLFDPDFVKLLPQHSNILKFQRLFNIYEYGEENYGGLLYIFTNITKENIKDAPTDTSFRKAIVSHISSGGIMRGGSGYRLV